MNHKLAFLWISFCLLVGSCTAPPAPSPPLQKKVQKQPTETIDYSCDIGWLALDLEEKAGFQVSKKDYQFLDILTEKILLIITILLE